MDFIGGQKTFLRFTFQTMISGPVSYRSYVRRNMRAVVIDEAHLFVEWQVFDICL